MRLNRQEILQFDPIPRKYLRQAPQWYATRTRARSRKLTADALHHCHPDGVPLAIWHDAANRSEMYTFQGCAFRWATVRNAVGPGLALAQTWSDGQPLAEIVRTTHEGLRALTGDDGSATRIRDLVLFCHGHTTSISYGGGGHQLRIADLEALTAEIADALSPQLRVILYACNTGRNANPAEAAEWMHTSLYEGGSMSFAGALRDGLVGRGKSECEVWASSTALTTPRLRGDVQRRRRRDGQPVFGRPFCRPLSAKMRAPWREKIAEQRTVCESGRLKRDDLPTCCLAWSLLGLMRRAAPDHRHPHHCSGIS